MQEKGTERLWSELLCLYLNALPRLNPGLFSALDDAAVEMAVSAFHSDAQAASF